MKKLTLTLENLRVDSFETGLGEKRLGTVHGHDTRETEFCPTPFKPCLPTQACPTRYTCARHDDELPGAGEPQLPPK
jgi:hypothetical protein